MSASASFFSSVPAPPMRWDGWGDPDRETVLSDAMLGLIRDALGVRADARSRRAPDDVVVPDCRLTDDDLAELAGIVGEDHVSRAPVDRLLRAAGRSTPDLLRRRATTQSAPDAVVVPGSTDEVAAVNALPPTSALLVMQRGPSAGARFLLDAERTSAGRSTEADIFLDDVTVSRKHAEFVREGQSFWVRDVGSLNGTYVNRERIDQVVLHAGDEVQIGKFRMTFHPSPHRESTPA